MKPGDLRRWTGSDVPNLCKNGDLIMIVDIDENDVERVRSVEFLVNGILETMTLGWFGLETEELDETG